MVCSPLLYILPSLDNLQRNIHNKNLGYEINDCLSHSSVVKYRIAAMIIENAIITTKLVIFEDHIIDAEDVTDNAYCKAYNDPIKLRHFCLLALEAGIQTKAIIPHTVKARISGLEK